MLRVFSHQPRMYRYDLFDYYWDINNVQCTRTHCGEEDVNV
jgi:hypothetical protein